MRVLLIDNYDSFTYNLCDYLLQVGAEVLVRRNDALDEALLDGAGFDAAVLSPGPGKPGDAGRLMAFIGRQYLTKPMLGICLGHQALGVHFGAALQKASVPVHGKTSLIRHFGDPLYRGIPSPHAVMRYHSLILTPPLGGDLVVLSETLDGEIMAMRHPTLPLWGVQYHPESILTDFGLLLLRNWVDMVGGVS